MSERVTSRVSCRYRVFATLGDEQMPVDEAIARLTETIQAEGGMVTDIMFNDDGTGSGLHVWSTEGGRVRSHYLPVTVVLYEFQMEQGDE